MFTGVRRHGAARPAVYSGVPGVSDNPLINHDRLAGRGEPLKEAATMRADDHRLDHVVKHLSA